MPFNVITNVNLDMARPNATVVNAVQYDSSGRVIRANLFNNGEKWVVPSGAYPIIRYKKTDRNGGFYDVDEKGSKAISFVGNDRSVVDITLALQVLTTPGNVKVQINFYNGSAERITTFGFMVRVEESAVEDEKIVSSDYYNALTEVIKTAVGAADIISARDTAVSAASKAQISAESAEAAVTRAEALLPSSMPPVITNWLSSHITNPSNPPIDTSLTVSGAAADAKAVGDIFNNTATMRGLVDSSITLLSHITTSGIYQVNATQNYSDRPEGCTGGGVLFVYRYGSGYVIQELRMFNQNSLGCNKYRVVHRTNYSIYMDWTPLIPENDIVGGLLGENDDLDNITDTERVYYYPTSAMPANAPFVYGCVVFVFGSHNTTSQKIQFAIGYGSDSKEKFAYRSLSGGNWHAWEYICSKQSTVVGKRLSIMGDSISAYRGYVPTGDGYAAYYNGSNCGVSSVTEMWWYRLLNATGMVLCKNNSVSGSPMSTGARPDRKSGCLPERTQGLADDQGNKPDYIIIYMGTNDYLAGVNVGSFNGTQTFPTNNSTFREAFAIAMLSIQNTYPMAKIFVCTLPHNESSETGQTPIMKRNGVLLKHFNDAIRELASLFHCEIIDLEQSRINTGNISSVTGDDQKLHPNALGQEMIFEEALKHFV